ncbi:hypothetical protein GDO81_006893 [Engystomops pustulosus]|uniref:Uncharacterized protein n=1 Tax=Engystomops pustulosus TaxID=76066 RepID=A0AAV7D042_ENGPU|nr:hypothetical protein GDO81_006893 [Engystomops pustulosus]
MNSLEKLTSPKNCLKDLNDVGIGSEMIPSILSCNGFLLPALIKTPRYLTSLCNILTFFGFNFNPTSCNNSNNSANKVRCNSLVSVANKISSTYCSIQSGRENFDNTLANAR